MLDPGSAADWVQASCMTGVVACLAAAGMWALTREQHERSVAPSPNTRALAAGGLLVGGVLAGTLTANAANTATNAAGSYAAPAPGAPQRSGTVDESKSQRPDEHLLTGDTASKVRAAALAKYPGATVLRVETDSDGVYEAHLTTTSGQRVTVEIGKDFKVTGLESAPRHP